MTKKERIKHIEAQLVAYHNTMSILEKKVEALEAWRKEFNYGRDDIPAQDPELLRCPKCASEVLFSTGYEVSLDEYFFYIECVECWWRGETYEYKEQAEAELRKRLGGV